MSNRAPWMTAQPKGWEVSPFKRLVDICNGRDHKAVEAAEGIPVYGSGGPFAFASDYLYDGEAVLLGRKGTVDKPLHVEGKFWAVDTMYWSKIRPGTCGKFAYYAATTIPFDYYTTSTALPSMTKGTLSNHRLLVPPLEVQKKIANFLDKETARIDSLIRRKQSLLELLQEKHSAEIAFYATKGLNQNVAFSDTGVDWLGQIPEHWESRRLGTIFAFRNEKNDPIRTEQILSLSIANGVTLYSEEEKTGGNKRKDDLSAYKLAHPGDIVINSMNVIVGAVGRSKWLGAISPVYYALYAIDKFAHVPYYEKIFLNVGFQRGLLRYGKGILIKLSGTGKLNTIRMKVSPDDLKALQFPVPPPAEQRKIAELLDQKTEAFNKVSAKIRASIDRLEEFRTALVKSAVTGQIDVATWGKQGQTDRRLADIQEAMGA